MTSRPFSELKADVLALCGIPDANTQEVARIERLINMRARKAYAMSDLWPRFLVRGEERICSEEGLLPYEQDGLQTIGTVRRIHASDPFRTCGAAEYISYAAVSDGIQIAGYQPSLISEGAPYRVYIDPDSGVMNPDLTGTFPKSGEITAANGQVFDIFTSSSNSNYRIYPVAVLLPSAPTNSPVTWQVGNNVSADYWVSDETSLTPPLTGYTAQGSAFGAPALELIDTYSCYVTYKAAFSETYDDGEEVPNEWEAYIVRGTYADWLRSEGRTEEAIPAEADARDAIEDELCKVSSQGGSDLATRVVTHSTTQAR